MKFYKTSVRIFLFYMLILPIFLKGSIITSSGVVVGIEQDEEYFEISKNRIEKLQNTILKFI